MVIPMSKPDFKRKKKLVGGDAQRRLLLLVFLGGAAGILVQSCTLAFFLTRTAESPPNDARLLFEEIPMLLTATAVGTFALTVPFFCMLTLTASFRVFGPLYRFRVFLRDVVEGRESAPCRIRKTDRLQDVCELLNAVSEPMRARNEERGTEPESPYRQAA